MRKISRLAIAGICTILLTGCAAQHSPIVDPLPHWNVEDTPYDAPEVREPLRYSQDDPLWAVLPYGTVTISEAGCGLCVAASTFAYLTESPITPKSLEAAVEGTCLVDNDMNDMILFAQFGAENYGLSHTEKLFEWDDVIAEVNSGHYVWLGVSGEVGDREYESHVICVWRTGLADYWAIYDPKQPQLEFIDATVFGYRIVMIYAVSVWKE